MPELSLLLVKPDAIKAHHATAILNRVRRLGLKVERTRSILLTEEQAHSLYEVHRGQPFFVDLIRFMTSAPCLAAIVSGNNALSRLATLCGHNNPQEAEEGTLRRLYGIDRMQNAVHSSAADRAQGEISLIFTEATS
jgi:nucleoside-diphosphate kinase